MREQVTTDTQETSVAELRSLLVKLWEYGSAVAEWELEISGKRRWNNNRLPTSADHELASATTKLTKEQQRGWPGKLRRAEKALLRWWGYFDDVNEALDQLPKDAVDWLIDLSSKRWKAPKLRRLLVELEAGLIFTRPTGKRNEYGLLLFRLGRLQNLPEDWREKLDQLGDFERDLLTLTREKDDRNAPEATTAQTTTRTTDKNKVEPTERLTPEGYMWLTQTQIADRTGYTPRAVYDWIRGKHRPIEVRDERDGQHLVCLAELDARKKKRNS